MNSDKSTLQSSGGNIPLRCAIVTVLVSLCSVPLFLSALSGPMGFVLIITPMIILQLPLVLILIRFRLLPNVEFGRPIASAEAPDDNVVKFTARASKTDI